jgi:putative transposase
MYKSFHRRNLPHLYFNDGIYFITYRLADTIPLTILNELSSSFKSGDDEKAKRIFRKYDSIIDSCRFGEKFLTIKEIAFICKSTLHYPDGKDYRLLCYCIMPNHIHLVFKLLDGTKGISKIMQSIKRISARKSNLLLNRAGKFWQDESFDRWIRDDKELFYIVRYILLNPVKAGMVKNWNDWEFTYCHPDYLVL